MCVLSVRYACVKYSRTTNMQLWCVCVQLCMYYMFVSVLILHAVGV